MINSHIQVPRTVSCFSAVAVSVELDLSLRNYRTSLGKRLHLVYFWQRFLNATR